MKIHNPIIRGMYPDPSICKANGKYYIVCSSFQYFPGAPIWESEDLVNWKQVGNCLTKKSQVMLHQVPSSGGVFAPTLRYHDGTFYMVTNNNTTDQNFYITTDDIYGEWSEPIFVDQGGIDPSLTFDGDKVYFTSNGTGANGRGCIFQCEINPRTGEKLTDSIPIWSGNGGRFLESPHLYHIGDWYYLMAAEGGTEYGHMITYARSKNPFGPFEGYPHNPVLTNRDYGGNENRIQGIGHGDLIEDEDGNYFIICLGFRQIGIWQALHHLGREVFLVPVHWTEDGWFTAGNDGVVWEWMDAEGGEKEQKDVNYDVSFETMGPDDCRWCYLRDYREENYCFMDKGLRMRGTEIDLRQADTPTFIGVRQSEFKTQFTVDVSGEAQEAGVTVYIDENHHYDLAVCCEEGRKKVILRIRIGTIEAVEKEVILENGENPVTLGFESDEQCYQFYCISGTAEKICLGSALTKYVASEVAGGFTGVFAGLYAVDGNGSWSEFTKLRWHQEAMENLA